MLMRTTLVTTLAVAAMLVGASCAQKTPLTESQKEYAGKWVDGESWIEIEQDGTLNYSLKEGNSTTSVTNGGVTITEGKMVVSMLGENEWLIDQEPTEENGVWTMKVDGRLFTRE